MTSNANNPSIDTSIYKSDGVLSSNRTVTMGGNSISFSGGNVGIGIPTPLNTVHVGAPAVPNTTGIRTSITSASAATAETAYLAVNASGDIVRGAAVSGGTKVWSSQTGTLNFGAQIGGIFEYTAIVNGGGFVTLKKNHSNNTNIVKISNIFLQHQQPTVCMSKDFSVAAGNGFDLSTNTRIISFDPTADKALPNGAFWRATINELGGNRYVLEYTSFGGGYAANCLQTN